jgi:hypothetical protein
MSTRASYAAQFSSMAKFRNAMTENLKTSKSVLAIYCFLLVIFAYTDLEDGGGKFHRKLGELVQYTTQYPRRQFPS